MQRRQRSVGEKKQGLVFYARKCLQFAKSPLHFFDFSRSTQIQHLFQFSTTFFSLFSLALKHQILFRNGLLTFNVLETLADFVANIWISLGFIVPVIWIPFLK
ncbi:hypothetical protein SDJN02_01313, partial [Cucurbita argyrosperma subsp. argyrosperma]